MKPIGIKIILSIHCIFFSTCLRSQKFDTGNYSDFDYGPHGVYGGHKLTNTTAKDFWQLSQINDTTAQALHINPATVVTYTVTVTFNNGLLSHVQELNQWKDTIVLKSYTPIGRDSLRVTNMASGDNVFLPGKYAIDVYKNELLVEESMYSNSGRLRENWGGYSTVRYDRYDDKNRFSRKKEASYYNSKNQPVIVNGRGFFRIVNRYDDNDHLVYEAFFDVNNKPMTIRSGNVSSCKYYYNDKGEIIRDEYFGLNGERTLTENGTSSIEHVYERGFEVKEIRRDSLDHIMRSYATGDGVAIIKTEYDERGNKIKESYYDENDQPIINHDGFHARTNKYSDNNMLLEVSYLDTHDQPGVDRDSVHAIHYTRNSIGRITEEYCVDLFGNKKKNYNDEVYMVRTDYIEFGRPGSYSYWQDSMTPMPRWNGAYKMTLKYDEDGRLTEFKYCDQNGAPFKTEDGTSTVRMSFQENGEVYKREFLFDSSLVMRTRGVSTGYAVIRYEYDSAGRTSELRFYGKDHQAVDAAIASNTDITAHRVVFIWKYARIIEQWFYKMNDKEPFFKLDCLKNDYLSVTGLYTGRKNSN